MKRELVESMINIAKILKRHVRIKKINKEWGILNQKFQERLVASTTGGE